MLVLWVRACACVCAYVPSRWVLCVLLSLPTRRVSHVPLPCLHNSARSRRVCHISSRLASTRHTTTITTTRTMCHMFSRPAQTTCVTCVTCPPWPLLATLLDHDVCVTCPPALLPRRVSHFPRAAPACPHDACHMSTTRVTCMRRADSSGLKQCWTTCWWGCVLLTPERSSIRAFELSVLHNLKKLTIVAYDGCMSCVIAIRHGCKYKKAVTITETIKMTSA